MTRPAPATLVRGWMVVLLLGGVTAYCIAEEITLTTYYPSPRGVYDQLRTAGNVQFGSIEPPDPDPLAPPPPRVRVVQDVSPNPLDDPATLVAPAFQVDRREADGTTLTPLMAIDAEGEMGIGTSTPQTAVDVSGTVRATDLTCANCLNADDIAPDAIGASEIAPDSVGDDELFNGGTWTLTSPLTITGANVNVTGTVSAGRFASGSSTGVTGSHFVPGDCPECGIRTDYYADFVGGLYVGSRVVDSGVVCFCPSSSY